MSTRDVVVPIENGIGAIRVKDGKFVIDLVKDAPNPDGIVAALWIGMALIEAVSLSLRKRIKVKAGLSGRLPRNWSSLDADCTTSHATKHYGA